MKSFTLATADNIMLKVNVLEKGELKEKVVPDAFNSHDDLMTFIDWGTATQLPTFSHKIVEEFVPRYNAGTVTMTDVIKALQANNPTDEFQIADIQEAVKLQGHTLAR